MISLLQLQYFQKLATEQHLTRTAEALHVSQSTLSMMIRKMEEELGTSLFDRRDHRITLNEYGTEYLRYVNTALESLDQGRQRLDSLRQAHSQKLSISVSHAQAWMDRILGFKALHPNSYIAVYAEDLHRYGDMLYDYTLDFVLSGITDFEDKRVECAPISRNDIVACLPENHPLAGRQGLYLRDLEPYPFIDLSAGLPFRKFTDGLFEAAGATCNRVMECDYDTRRRVVQDGQGYALTPDTEATRISYGKCTFVPILDECAVRTMAIFWKKGRQFTPIMHDFFNYILKTAKHPIQD